jgi:formylglycine-generating enzyme required for sulfatase activity
MHSNVWQWCQDRFAPYPDAGPADRYPEKDSARVLRGGCWALGPSGCRSAFRDWHVAGLRGDSIGCRVCLCHE